MKRLVSSIFIALIFLNVMGYYGLLLGLKYKNTQDLINQFDAGTYNTKETVTVKIPFKAPYAFYSELYERVDGDFERDGEVYRLIKQRLYRDTFHIVCLRDVTGTALNNALSDYVKTFAETPAEDGHEATILPLFIKDYIVRHFSIQHLSAGWELAVRKESSAYVFIDSFHLFNRPSARARLIYFF